MLFPFGIVAAGGIKRINYLLIDVHDYHFSCKKGKISELVAKFEIPPKITEIPKLFQLILV